MTLNGFPPAEVEADADMAVNEVGFTNERRVFVVKADADADVVDDDDDAVAKAKCLLTIPVPVVNAKDDDDNGRDTSARSEADDRNFISRRVLC